MAFSINPTRRSTVSFGKPLSGSQCFCVFCKRKKEFGIPSELADRFVSGKVVLFAGAGICDDAMYEGVADLLSEVHDAHDWLHSQYSLTKHPQVLFCAWYQDGMEQALSRILRLRKTGKSSDLHRLIGTAQSYEHFSRRLKQDRRYGDAAYCSGYSNGYYFAAQFTNRNVKKLTPPLYFYFGHQSWSRSEYRRRVGSFPTLHRAAAKFAQQLAAKLPEQSGFVLHHPPSLDLEKYLNEQEPQRKKHTKRHLAHA